MLTKREKIVKIQNLFIFLKKIYSLEIWWIGTFPTNLALTCFTVSKNRVFTGGSKDGRTTDTRAMIVALLAVAQSRAEIKLSIILMGK